MTGIDDIAVYIPQNRISLESIYQRRISQDPSQTRRLAKAIDSTGQKAIRFPSFWEDSATLGAGAVASLLEGMDSDDIARIRHLVAATETTVDLSKPLSNYVLGMLDQTGTKLPGNLGSWQIQHACAAGTLGMINVASQVALSQDPRDRGVVLCSDVARYEAPSSAEITQGAGAVAILLGNNPRLLELDLGVLGYASADVDDFFRPLGSTIAKVKGQYSMQCYHEAANSAFLDYCRRAGKIPAEVLGEHDYYVFHVPFAKMAYTAARSLISQHLHLVDGEVDEYLGPKGFFEPLEATAQVGNIYTGAAFLNLATLLRLEYAKHGQGIVGRKILFSSYGSGNTMVIMSMTLAPGAPEVIARWPAEGLIGKPVEAPWEVYEEWIHKDMSRYNEIMEGRLPDHSGYYLQSIREDGYRVYAHQA